MTTSKARPDTSITPGTMLREGYDAFARGDIPSVLALPADDVRWTEPAGSDYAGTFVGPQQVMENVFARVGAEWTSFAVVPERFLPCGDTVVVIVRFEVTHATTGRSAVARAAHVWEFADGKVVALEMLADTHLMREAAGV